ncbi:MAG: GNAT family N-acetyltransferase [Acidimicrobiales bacterium]
MHDTPPHPPPSSLDHPVWVALHGRQRRFGRSAGGACRYDPELSPFCALDPAALAAGGPALAAAWGDLARLVGPGGLAVLVAGGDASPTAPVGWSVERAGRGLQMVAETVATRAVPGAVRLGPADSAEMTALVELAQPGPFLARTVELGGYVGRRARGLLVAMAGERMGPPGFTEISAVATHPTWRGRGLASDLVGHVARTIADRGDVPFLHVAESNGAAIRLYRRLGFSVHQEVTFTGLRAPERIG